MAQELLECSVCLQTLENPHVLPRCGHSFCLACIQALPLPARCPLCREPCEPRQATPNFALQQLLASSDSLPSARPSSSLQPSAGRPVEPTRPKLRRQGTSLEAAKRAYNTLGVPRGLAQALADEADDVALRVYLLDNSGSMQHPDGGVIQSEDGQLRRMPATRWQELTEMATTHADWNRTLGVPCEFVLLNSPTPSNPMEGRDIFTINAEKGDTAQQVQAMRSGLARHYPEGRTPLGARVSDIAQRLGRNLQELQQTGRKVLLTIATDGLPDSRPELVQALRQLPARLPVRVVIRLCTDEDSVVDFYNDLDKDVELPLDILDDFCGEAKEIRRYNPWLVYTPLLHTIREAGTGIRVLDFMDERRLTSLEAAMLSQFLLSDGPPSMEPVEFLKAIEKELACAAPVWDICQRRMAQPVHLQALRAAVCPKYYAGAAGLLRSVGLGSAVDWYYDISDSEESDSDSESWEPAPRWPCGGHRPFAEEIVVA